MKKAEVVLVVMAHYNNQNEVVEFLNHLAELPLPSGWDINAVVVDNSLNWEGGHLLPLNAEICQPEKNVGYLNACAYAFEYWMDKKNEIPSWVCITNTDIKFGSATFSKLLSKEWPNSVALVGPDIVLPSGARQNPFLGDRPSKSKMKFYTLLYQSERITKVWQACHDIKKKFRGEVQHKIVSPSAKKIYAPHGSVIFVRSSFIMAGGVLRYEGFMYGEEIYLAEQTLKLGMEAVWWPELRVLHNEHSTTGNAQTLTKLKWMRDSMNFLYCSYFAK